jgi:hypothetical protein
LAGELQKRVVEEVLEVGELSGVDRPGGVEQPFAVAVDPVGATRADGV